jgi:type VI secretion system protein ImpL
MKRFFTNWWVLSVLTALILVLILVVGLPLFVGFMRPLWVRLTLLFLIASTWGLLAFLRVRKAKKASAAIAAELAQPNAADEEGGVLAGRMKEALAALKSASGKKRDYLYTRPWYVIIGPPGAGKTTALLNSGLRFPFSEQSLKGVGGTRNLDFWFADEAVMIDTAGRYTTQTSDYAVDSKGWQSFLGLLKRHRPLQPINGIIVAIGVDDLIRSDRAAIDAHANAVRRRLAELSTTLEVTAPVYVMLTKADLLAGFTEYYDDLDVEGRRAVLGATLPFSTARSQADELAKAFDGIAQAVSDRQAKRLFEEVDAQRRSLLLGFPSQLQSLRSRLMRFLEGVVGSGDDKLGALRGFYLTSGVQEGAPLDRILSGMADVYDRPQRASSAAGSGKAYFLNRLLSEVMFPEAGLVQMDPRARARQRTRLVAAISVIAAFTVLTMALWGVSYARNRSFQDDTVAAATKAETLLSERQIDLKEVRGDDADLRQALPFLNTLREMPWGYAALRREGGPPLTMRLGLFQSSLSRQSEESYREALRRVLLPRLLLRLEDVMASNRGDAMALYEPLKTYLMLGGQGPLDKAATAAWVEADWTTNVFPGADSAVERRQLKAHLAALLEDTDMASVWPERRAQLNGELVQSARAEVQALDPAQRAYAIMKQNAAAAGEPWRAAAYVSEGEARAFANSDAVLRTQVPFFFTRDGYEKAYLLALANVGRDVERDAWVLGETAEEARASLGNVRQGLAGSYASDYIAAWNGVIEVMQPADYFQDATAMNAFTKNPSPLKKILLELRKNTIFEGGASAAASKMVRDRINRSSAGRFINDMKAGRETGLDAAGQIAAAFRDVHEYVGDGKGAAPIDTFVDAMREAGKTIAAARSLGGAGGADAMNVAMAQATAQVNQAAGGAPPQLGAFTQAAAKGTSAAQVTTASGAVSDAYAQAIMPPCREVAQERYPFSEAPRRPTPPWSTCSASLDLQG